MYWFMFRFQLHLSVFQMHLLSFFGIRETLLCIFNGCALAVSHFSSSVALGRGCQRKTSQKVRLPKGLTWLGLQFFQSLLLAWPRDQLKKLWKVPWLPWTPKSKKKTIGSLQFPAKLLSLEKTRFSFSGFWSSSELFLFTLLISHPQQIWESCYSSKCLIDFSGGFSFSLALQLQL